MCQKSLYWSSSIVIALSGDIFSEESKKIVIIGEPLHFLSNLCHMFQSLLHHKDLIFLNLDIDNCTVLMFSVINLIF